MTLRLWPLFAFVIFTSARISTRVAFPFSTQLGDAFFDNSKDTTSAPSVIEWDLNNPPEENSTNHLVFDTVYSLLQHWPNTRYRNGHNIVPGTIPLGTQLYHGTDGSDVPNTPEWLAMDPEHSYLFCRGLRGEGCWHLTFVTARPLKIIYFDGSSAAKMEGGPMDSQDILLWGTTKPEWTHEERKRINELCAWGRNFGIDGFVRMVMDFEIMLCDFNSGLQPVSKLQLTSPIIDQPTEDPRLVVMYDRVPAAAAEAGSLHDHYPGDPRIQLDLSQLVSFYDTELVPSLIPSRLGQTRYEHRLHNISSLDVQLVMNALSSTLTAPRQASGVDWMGLFRVITLRYANRLEVIHHHLNVTDHDIASRSPLVIGHLVLDQLKIILTPYMIHNVVPLPGDPKINAWASPVYRHCATTHTEYIASFSWLMRSEHLLLRAIEGTNREI